MARFEDGIAETALPGDGLVEHPEEALLAELRAILHRPA